VFLRPTLLAAASLAAATLVCTTPASATDDKRYFEGRFNEHYDGRGFHDQNGRRMSDRGVQLGPRPFYLVEGMDAGPLKDRLMQCMKGPFYRSDFSIAHRGAALQFPEHTKESYEAGARQGAGIMECDVTFTRDRELVCRHAECDLHTTTNIVNTPLNAKCSVPYAGPGSSPSCCTSDLTLSEFRTLVGKMDAANPAATNAAGYLGGTANWRTDLYTGRGTLLTHKESIELGRKLGVKYTPELKSGNPERIKAVFGSQAAYAQKMIDEYKAAGIHPRDVWPQSFNKDDVIQWAQKEPGYGAQAVYLDSIDPTATPAIPRQTVEELKQLRAKGVNIFAPPTLALLSVNNAGELVASPYAKDIRAAGFDIITWTVERSDLRRGAASAGFYYLFDREGRAVKKDSDIYKVIDALARDVGIIGVFSDWPATVTYYANCMGLK